MLYLLLPPPARGDVSSCWASLVCLFSLSWYTCGFYTQCHAAGGPSGVPLLADSGWLLYSYGDGFAWGWGLSCHSCTVPPLFSFLCLRSFPFRCFPFGVLLPYRVGWHVCLQFAGLLFGMAGGGLLRLFLSACALFSLLQVHWVFWASPALLACWGGYGFAPCVRVFQLRCCLLGLQVGFPCCLFLTLGGCTSG